MSADRDQDDVTAPSVGAAAIDVGLDPMLRSDLPVRDPSDALTSLARELYWAGAPGSRRATDTGSLRERLQSFAHRVRVDAMERYPSSEPGLDRSPRLRRRTKRALWSVGRFATLRYDRLLAELAELNVQLAERLSETERELERLRHERPDPEADA